MVVVVLVLQQAIIRRGTGQGLRPGLPEGRRRGLAVGPVPQERLCRVAELLVTSQAAAVGAAVRARFLLRGAAAARSRAVLTSLLLLLLGRQQRAGKRARQGLANRSRGSASRHMFG